MCLNSLVRTFTKTRTIYFILAGEFHDTFTKVSTVPQVLHPTINIAKLEKEVPGSENVMINDIKPDAEKNILSPFYYLNITFCNKSFFLITDIR